MIDRWLVDDTVMKVRGNLEVLNVFIFIYITEDDQEENNNVSMAWSSQDSLPDRVRIS